MTAGQRLRERREEMGLSLRDVAGQLGISHVFLFETERGEKLPSPDTVDRLCRVLKLNAAAIRLLFASERCERIYEHWRVR